MTIDPTTIDLSRYRFIPGETEVGEDINLDEVVIHHGVSGQRVTTQGVEQEATELAKKYPGLLPGGKSLSGDGSHSPVIRSVVSKTTKERVREAAKMAGVTESKWVRLTIEEKLAA
jgi:hypothetical protein